VQWADTVGGTGEAAVSLSPQTLNILEGAALSFCPSHSSLSIEGKYVPHLETKK